MLPVVIAVTSPELLMVATAGVELLQVPPDVVSVKVVVVPVQIDDAPFIIPTDGLLPD